MDWIVDAPETFWLFGSGTPPCPSNRDWTASTVWLSMPGEGRRSSISGCMLLKLTFIQGCLSEPATLK